jgi:AT-rich interactive domain-containing protein 1
VILLLQCTKTKSWKDIAAQLGIGASSSGAYTLKKHYGKNLLAYECQFDRGGMDPGPILEQVESQSKKKAKGSMPQPPPVPSPGSQDSRDSYSNSSDPYGGYPPPGAAGMPPSHNSYPPPSRSATSTPPNSGSSAPNSDRPPSHPGKERCDL